MYFSLIHFAMHAIINIYFFSKQGVHEDKCKLSWNSQEGKKNKMKKMKKLQVKVWVQNKTRYNDVNIQTNVKNKTTPYILE